MEPPGGLPPDRGDRQLVPVIPTVKPILTLNLPQQQQQQLLQHPSSHAVSPSPSAFASLAGAAAAATAAPHTVTSSSSSATASTSPALASTATAISATTQAATAFSGSSVGQQQHVHQPHHSHHNPQLAAGPTAQQQTQQAHSSLHPQQHNPSHQHPPITIQHGHSTHHNSSSTSGSATSSLLGGSAGGGSGTQQQQQTIEKLSRPLAFDKMESLVREMQDPEHGVPVRQQKMFLTSIPYAFMGYDLIEWLMDRLFIEESEALNIANQLCLHGYFFPVNDTKTLTVKDDSSLYRFQTPYYWPWQHKAPDNVEYAIYLAKRSLRNKQRHALEDYEAEALTSLHKNLKGKWDFISMQAEEQVRLAKERKKGDKIVGDSQERAYWRVHRPPPGQFTPLEPCPIPSRDRLGQKPNKKKTVDDVQREVDYLKKSLNRTRMKMSQACESLVGYSETFVDYDFFLQPVLPSNPWVTEDVTFWQLNNIFVNTPTEKRVKRWAISIEELVSDPTGLQEFTTFLEKEYSHENIRFWIEVNRLRRSAHSQVVRKVNEIYEEFLKPGAPCEINIDGKTMESVLKGLKNPSRFTFDAASEHIYMLLLKKDCYPRFVRSDHYKRLLETGIQPSHKKRFFNFGGVSGAKKKMTAALSGQPGDGTSSGKATGNATGGGMMQAPPPGNLSRRRGSDRSLTGSAHELAVIGVNKDMSSKVPHSHSQSNLSEIPYSETVYRGDMAQCQRVAVVETGIYAANEMRVAPMHIQHQEPPKPKTARLETTLETSASAVCPWDVPDEPPSTQAPVPTRVQLSVCPWEQDTEHDTKPAATPAAGKSNNQRLTSTSSDITDMTGMQRNLGIRHQNTVDSGEAGIKRLMPNFTEQRRASMSFTPSRISEYQFGSGRPSGKTTSTPSPGGQNAISDSTKSLEPFASAFPPLFTPLQAQRVAVALATSMGASAGLITKDPPSSSDAEIEEELNKLSISERNSESSASEMCALPPPTPTPPPLTKITPPPPEDCGVIVIEPRSERNVTRESSKTESPSVAETIDEEDDEEEAVVAAATVSQPVVEELTITVETEVDAEIQDVQIELIEAHRDNDVSPTPTIQVDEPPPVEIPPPKSRTRKLVSNAAVEVVEPELEQLNNLPSLTPKEGARFCTPTKMQSPSISFENTENCSADAEVAAISSIQPPPLPPLGPMEEEAELLRQQQQQEQFAGNEHDDPTAEANQEELSPTTDEYQEGLQFGDNKEDYEYDIVDTDLHVGYIPPAPTPAPSLAPLAELDVDTVDDEPFDENHGKDDETAEAAAVVSQQPPVTTPTEELRKRRKKRNSDGKKMSSIEEKDKEKTMANEPDRNAVCPWEDENVTTSDGTFVKTYATLGYL